MNTASASSSDAANQQAVHLAIYDLSQGMARTLSSQFLGAQHAVDIIPHTALVVFGKEYYFGMGIQSCSPHEFRISRGIHPIEIQLLGFTTKTREMFETWCHEQTRNGKFNASAYDFFHKNCNNFSEEAAKSGLGLSVGVPSYILDLPSKFLNSPMGRMVRPWLEQMQIMNNSAGASTTTTTTTFESMTSLSSDSSYPSTSSVKEVASSTNPWANIQTNTPLLSSDKTSINIGINVKIDTCAKSLTPLLDKQKALLSSDAKIVNICVDRLKTTLHEEEKEEEEICQLLLKLSDNTYTWTYKELKVVHSFLCNIIRHEGSQCVSHALMLLRLVMLKRPMAGMQAYDGKDDNTTMKLDILSEATQLMAKLVHDEEGTSATNRAIAWCVLSNAIGSSTPTKLQAAAFAFGDVEGNHNIDGSHRCDDKICEYSFNQILDRALNDCDSLKERPSSSSVRQSAVAFLYNSSRYLTFNCDTGPNKIDGDKDDHGSLELSESMVSILLGCIEYLQTESDAITLQRLYMTVGQILISHGKMASNLIRDLGLMDEEEIRRGKEKGDKVVEGLADEVASILRRNDNL
jgi:hypothetical protein